MNTMTTILGFDIKGVSNPILMTEILIETPSDRKEMTVPIDMDYMGIDEDTDFDMELSKDFIREVEKFYRDNGRIPTADELKRLVEKYDYGCHPAPDGDIEPFDSASAEELAHYAKRENGRMKFNRFFLQCEIDEVTADCNIGF